MEAEVRVTAVAEAITRALLQDTVARPPPLIGLATVQPLSTDTPIAPIRIQPATPILTILRQP